MIILIAEYIAKDTSGERARASIKELISSATDSHIEKGR